MKRFTQLAAQISLASFASAAIAQTPLTVRAGEWQTRNNDGPVNLVCIHSDMKFDQPTMTKLMTMVGADKCSPPEFRSVGPVTNYNVACNVAGGRITVRSTITVQGPDAYTTHSQSHFEGGSVKIPDQDDTQVSKRLGACKAGDVSSGF